MLGVQGVFAERGCWDAPVPSLAAVLLLLPALVGQQSPSASPLSPCCPCPASPGLCCTGTELCPGSGASLACPPVMLSQQTPCPGA